MSAPTPEELRSLLRYEPETGHLFWLPRDPALFATRRGYAAWTARFVGKPALVSNSHGYRAGAIWNRWYLAHRVIWAMMSDAWPEHEIDHINRDRSDNRWFNLREVTHLQNMRNLPQPVTNKSGVTGVYWNARRGAWAAHIRDGNGGQYHIGYFDDLEDARVAREVTATLRGFHENHGQP